ncbi:MAG: hypothetical protein GX493_01015 [Firmicutes bacterium]|nr:hypothetical protein [Bacillota bacterium]
MGLPARFVELSVEGKILTLEELESSFRGCFIAPRPSEEPRGPQPMGLSLDLGESLAAIHTSVRATGGGPPRSSASFPGHPGERNDGHRQTGKPWRKSSPAGKGP